MDKKIVALAALLFFCCACTGDLVKKPTAYEMNKTFKPVDEGPQMDLIFDPLNIDGAALPNMRDLPVPPIQSAKKYTGIIKNNTKYEVSIPALNSGATIIIPPYSWVEYTAWKSFFTLTVYHNGKAFYCLNIHARLQNYPFMCKKYDFIAEIVKEEPVIRERPGDKGVEALG